MDEFFSNDDADQSLHLLVVLSRAYKTLIDFAQKDMKQYGLNATQFAVLELLYHKGAQPIQQIGHRILLSSGSITYVVDQLSKKGMLTRKPYEEDRRVIYAELTDNGREFMKKVFPKHQKAIQAVLSQLTKEEKSVLILLLKKLGLTVAKKSSG